MTHAVTSAQAKAITARINEAIAPIIAEFGLDLAPSKTTYGQYYALKIEASPVTLNENGVNTSTKEAQEFLSYGHYSYDLPVEALGKTFTINGTPYQFLGTNTRSFKYPLLFLNLAAGKQIRFAAMAADTMKRQLTPQEV